MKRSFLAAISATVFFAAGGLALADDQDVKVVVDKAIKALGGEEKLSKFETFTMKAKGTITFNGNGNPFTSQATVQGVDHIRSEFEGEFNGNPVKGVTVIDGKKGWRKFGDMVMEMDDDAVTNEKRNLYLMAISNTLVALKGKDYKLETAGEEKVGDSPAIGVKVTGPDGKDFTIYFDKKSNLPAKLVAKVAGFMGEEFTQETIYSDFKEFDGIKKATKLESKRDGEKFVDQEITEFKMLDKAPADTFAEPK
jgi:hypothetical protein